MNTITHEDFQKLDIRVGKVIEADGVPGSEKMIRCVVDFGPQLGRKIIFSGIKRWYKPEDLIGKLLPYIVNLEPRPMFGEESQGMLLAVLSLPEGKLHGGEAVLIEPDKKVSPGAKII